MGHEMPDWVIIILNNVVLATLVGLITSGIFLYILSMFRPKIEISPAIARSKASTGEKVIYRIKVLNRTNAPIVDIRAQLHVFKNHQTATGEIWKSRAIEFQRSDPLGIGKYDRSDSEANYAYRFVTYEDIESIWNDDRVQFLRFRIYARHSFSGFGVFSYRDYRLKRSSIKAGEFSKGDTFEIA